MAHGRLSNSATLINCVGLAFPGEINGKYLVELFLAYHAKLTGDLKVGWQTPAGTVGWWTGRSADPGAAGGRIASWDQTLYTDLAGTISLGGDDAFPMFAAPVAFVALGANPGTVQLKFAQNTAIVHTPAPGTYIRVGSAMRVTRLA